MINKLDTDYQALMQRIIHEGVSKEDRTGTGTISIFGTEIKHDMRSGFPLLTTKKMAFKTMVTELLWFLKGDTNIKYLVENGCNIWNGDAYKRYHNNFAGYEDVPSQEWFVEKIKTDAEFARKWGDLGPIYGKQWRKWQGWMSIDGSNKMGSLWYDQIGQLIHSLKTNPDSRRLMVSAWNVGELDQMTLPPCHYGFQVYTIEMGDRERELRWCESLGKDISYASNIEDINAYLDKIGFPKRKISLMWNQRSADYFLGVPFNIASYGLLLKILGKIVNMIPDQLIGRFGDTHLYSNHLEAARTQIPREAYDLPDIKILKDEDYWRGDIDDIINGLTKDDFELVNYESHPTIKAPLSN